MKAVVAAMIGGLIGALVWGGISYFTGFEIGYIAWAIGALIGFLSSKAGGHGSVNGALCAGIAALALLAGKYVAVDLGITKEIKPGLEPLYDLLKSEATDFLKISSDKDEEVFILQNGYSEGDSVENVTEAEMTAFRKETVPLYKELNAGMTYDDYQEHFVDEMGGTVGLIKEDLGLIDIVFFALGIFTAFKLGSGDEEEHDYTA